jgi:hypothetical protein
MQANVALLFENRINGSLVDAMNQGQTLVANRYCWTQQIREVPAEQLAKPATMAGLFV